MAEWQNRPLEALYALVFFDALRVKVRDEGTVRNKAVYLALGVRPDGSKEILGLWIEQTEGAKFWLRVMNDQGMADQVHDAGLDLGVWEHRIDRLGEALEAIDDGDQHVCHLAVTQLSRIASVTPLIRSGETSMP